VDKGIWKKAVRENADEKTIGSCDRHEEGVCTEEGESIPIVERRKRRGKGICKGAVMKRIYLAIKVTTNGTSILCREERQ